MVHYTCHGNATFTSSGSSTVLRMTSSNDSLTTDQPIANWTQIQLEYSSAAPLTGSDIGIYIREPNTPWQEVSAGVQYRDFSILATLPEKGTFYLLLRNKKDAPLDLRQIIYFITPCDCYQPE
ncbi:MAG: hypothetical protein IJS82_06855 [Paludibacteraceae bacterium]|nr:hypothetical protein [Paludibacteraceae bacterium]